MQVRRDDLGGSRGSVHRAPAAAHVSDQHAAPTEPMSFSGHRVLALPAAANPGDNGVAFDVRRTFELSASPWWPRPALPCWGEAASARSRRLSSILRIIQMSPNSTSAEKAMVG